MFDGTLTFRAYGAWRGVTAEEGDLASSFSNLRLAFSAPVADGGQPGLTSAEELLLGAAISGYAAALIDLCRQMVLDVAELQIEGELTRTFDEIEGHRISSILLKPEVVLRTGLGFEKVHDMFRRATALARQRSPVLRALEPAIKIQVEPSYR
ncbi:MAG: OsmC family protein [Bacillota bacterium]